MNTNGLGRTTGCEARVLAVLLLLLIIGLALFSDVFRFGSDGGRAIGQQARPGSKPDILKWFR